MADADAPVATAPAAVARATVERFWATLYARDWAALARFFTDDARRARLAAAAASLGRPSAARDIVADLRSLGLL